MYDYVLPLVGPNGLSIGRSYAQVPSHRSPSVERFRIHVKGMVGSPGWLDGFPEVGRRRGPWRGRWAKDLLDASTAGENNSIAARCSVPKTMQKPRSRGDATIAMSRWLEILRSGADPPIVAPSSNKRSPRSCLSTSSGPPKKPRGWAIRVGHR